MTYSLSMCNSTILTFFFFSFLGFFSLSAKPSSIKIKNPSWMAQSVSILLDGQALGYKKVRSSVLRQGAFSWSGQFVGDGTSLILSLGRGSLSWYPALGACDLHIQRVGPGLASFPKQDLPYLVVDVR